MRIKSFAFIYAFAFLSNHSFSQSASFISGIKNDWSFFLDRIMYTNEVGVFYRLNNDLNLYYSDGTTSGTQKTGYLFSDDFFSPDLSVYAHDDSFTAMGTDRASHDIIIFKNKSATFEYIEKASSSFDGLTFYKGNLYYLFSKSGAKSNKLIEYNPKTKAKREIISFDTNGAYGICTLGDKLIVVGYKGGNRLLSIDPMTGSFDVIYTFNATNTSASYVNFMLSGENLYFWYPNGTSTYSLFVTKGKPNTTTPVLDNLDKFDPFLYYARNSMTVGNGNLIWRLKFKNDQNNYAYFSDGTVQGTKKINYSEVKDFRPDEFTFYCGDFYFAGLDEKNERKLFKVSGASFNAIKLSDAIVLDIEKFNNRLYISAELNSKSEMYAWDEKLSKVEFVLDINGQARDSEPRELTATKDKLFMTAVRSNTDISYNLAVMTEPTRTKEDCLNSSIDTDEKSDFLIYPNPFNTNFTVENKDLNSGLKKCTVTDLFGKTIGQFENVDLPFEINTVDWSSGMYFIKIENSSTSASTYKLVKN